MGLSDQYRACKLYHNHTKDYRGISLLVGPVVIKRKSCKIPLISAESERDRNIDLHVSLIVDPC